MKKLTTICCALSIILLSCQQNPEVKQGKRDTSFTVITYANDWTKDDYRTLTAVRISYDTLMEKRDSSAAAIRITKEQVHDTAYFVRVDAGKPDSIAGQPILDSLGKPKWKSNILWAKVNKASIVHDFK